MAFACERAIVLNSAEWQSGYVTLALLMADDVPSELRTSAAALEAEGERSVSAFFDEKKAVRARALAEGLSAVLLDLEALRLHLRFSSPGAQDGILAAHKSTERKS
jgi:hypothetical protein